MMITATQLQDVITRVEALEARLKALEAASRRQVAAEPTPSLTPVRRR